jgi:hypothetical protein
LPGAHPDWYSGFVAMNVYQAVKQAMQDLVAPQIESLKGDIAGLRGEMSGIRGEMNGIRAEIRALDERLTIALDVRERIVALEARFRN